MNVMVFKIADDSKQSNDIKEFKERIADLSKKYKFEYIFLPENIEFISVEAIHG